MSIIVAGRGAAGWMAALYTKYIYPDAHITVVYDDKTPIIGVGESTTPIFLDFMKTIDISTEELIKNCDATLKHSIKFTNWKGDGTSYQHAFIDNGGLLEKYFDALSNGINLDDVNLGATLANNNKVSIPVDNIDDNVYSDTTYAVHFDAKKMAEYLQSVGISRGIKTISGKIEDVLLDRDGFVTDIILDTKQTIKTDFVFDCTGFARFFVNKIYNSPTVSYEKILPVKRAMPFFLDNTDITPSYTEAIAMKYGWMWKIPVGKRYGCGYVFDSDYVTDEEAYEEICEITKQRPYVPRKITFKPEYNTKPLNKNTLALGLAHGFLEPLEATSLMITIFMLKVLHSYNIFNRNEIESRTETYNNSVLKYVENCVEMVYIHYLTPREDTEFWQKFKNMIPISVENTLNKIENFDIKNPDPELMYMSPFNIHNILKCMGGVDYVKRDTIERNMGTYTYSKLKNYIEEIQNICKKSKNHDEYINEITNI